MMPLITQAARPDHPRSAKAFGSIDASNNEIAKPNIELKKTRRRKPGKPMNGLVTCTISKDGPGPPAVSSQIGDHKRKEKTTGETIRTTKLPGILASPDGRHSK